MLDIVIGKYNYRVTFKHQTEGTDCNIFRRELTDEERPEVPFAAGKSHRVSTDNPNKAIGRKVALKRALEQAQFDRDTRASVWAAYHDKLKPVV